MTPRLPAVLGVAMLLTPVVVLAGCMGFGFEAERPGKYLPEPDPAQRVAEAGAFGKAVRDAAFGEDAP